MAEFYFKRHVSLRNLVSFKMTFGTGKRSMEQKLQRRLLWISALHKILKIIFDLVFEYDLHITLLKKV